MFGKHATATDERMKPVSPIKMCKRIFHFFLFSFKLGSNEGFFCMFLFCLKILNSENEILTNMRVLTFNYHDQIDQFTHTEIQSRLTSMININRCFSDSIGQHTWDANFVFFKSIFSLIMCYLAIFFCLLGFHHSKLDCKMAINSLLFGSFEMNASITMYIQMKCNKFRD